MRQNVTIALLSVCSTLLAVNLYVAFYRAPQFPVAFGQAVGTPTGQVAIATGQTSSGGKAVVYIYDIPTKKLACYSVEGAGIELKGVRELTWDLQAEDFTPPGGKTSVKAVRDAINKLKAGDDKRK